MNYSCAVRWISPIHLIYQELQVHIGKTQILSFLWPLSVVTQMIIPEVVSYLRSSKLDKECALEKSDFSLNFWYLRSSILDKECVLEKSVCLNFWQKQIHPAVPDPDEQHCSLSLHIYFCFDFLKATIQTIFGMP